MKKHCIEIPFNGDITLPERVSKVIPDDFFYVFYAPLPGIISGRPSADTDKSILLAEKYPDKFLALLNFRGVSNIDTIYDTIDFWVKRGLRRFTVSISPKEKFFIETLKNIYGDSIFVNLGVFSFINEWSDSDKAEISNLIDGVIIPHYTANRNANELMKYVKIFGDKCIIFLNQICVFGCNFYKEHARFLRTERKTFNPYFFTCSNINVENPLMGTFYRPEDVPKIVSKFGIRHFKIINRKDDTDIILEKVYHYTHFVPTHNLFKLIKPQQRQICPLLQNKWDEMHDFFTKTVISSDALPDDFFENTMNCSVEKCGKTCRYCHSVWKEITHDT